MVLNLLIRLVKLKILILCTSDEKDLIFRKSFGDYRQILYLLYELKLNIQINNLNNQKKENINDNNNQPGNINKEYTNDRDVH